MKLESTSIAPAQYVAAGSNMQQSKQVEEPSRSEEENTEKLEFPGEKQFIDAIEKANKNLKISDTSLKFSIHEKTKQIIVKVIDNETKETVREIPPEKILDMVASMLEKTGLFVNKRV